MNAAILGCGAMGAAHAGAYASLGVCVAAVCDQDKNRAENLAKSTGGRAYLDLTEMLDTERPDVVSICTPAFNHLDAIRVLASRGVATLCEKPFAPDMAQAQEAYAAVKQAGIPFRLGFKMRYESAYAAARKIVESGEIGALRYVFISHFQPLSEQAWYMDIGVGSELLVHAMDISCWMFDETPAEVRMHSEYRLGKTGEDQARIELRFGDGRQALIAGGYMPGYPPVRGKHDFVFQFIGEKGYVCGKRNSAIEVFSPERVEILHPDDVNAFQDEIRDFLAATEGILSGGATLEDALRSQRVLAAAKASENTGTFACVERM
ncbi:Gfo/Idh/MocA family oxidoreductase [Eubacteriales bacterium OttesenSCG-928-N13]|nr:Gfo/Idh/MocA family oxidoreductase [Eubacteriales bacterium OttesenSCG-928-N13]